MRRQQILAVLLTLLAFSLCVGGCGDKLLDPTQIGRFRPVPAVNVILDSLGVAQEASAIWEGTEDPKPRDVIAYETDYVFGSGDTVRIMIFELLRENAPFVNDYVVTETGKISISEVGDIEVVGLTESQLEEQIKQILSPTILKDPTVSVILLNSAQRAYSILGNGIPRPSRYAIPRYDFRLTDALAIAGGVNQFNVSYAYISRSVTGKDQLAESADLIEAEKTEAEPLMFPEDEMLEIIAPRVQGQLSGDELLITTSEMATSEELLDTALPEGFEISLEDDLKSLDESLNDDSSLNEADLEAGKWVFEGGKWVYKSIEKPIESLPEVDTESGGVKVERDFAREAIDEPLENTNMGRIEWIFQDGKWIPIQLEVPEAEVARPRGRRASTDIGELVKEPLSGDIGWDEIGAGGLQRRVIKIPIDKLLGGNPRYNIIIRPGDSIHVPVDIIGEFSILGNVNAQGFIALTGRPITLKMAIAAAGGLGPLAYPERCEITRRIGRNKEQTVMVNLDKIASGEQPDFFIKPNDLINVGTHPTSRWRAVLRNAFRATYGFGFIYDRNFADRDFGTSRPIPF